MAVVTLAPALPDSFYWADFFEPSETIVSTKTATTYAYQREDGYKVSFGGTGLIYDPDNTSVPVGGTFTSVTVRNSANVVLFTITGLSADAVDIYYRINGWGDESGDGFSAVSQLLIGNDTVNGSENDDDISAGEQEGNDTINAKGGDDFVKGDRGNDKIDGGTGYDTLTYDETIYNSRGAFKGISLDAAAGTVNDSWGNTDTISNFEQFRGSVFNDVMKGSDQDIDGEAWSGLRGVDTIDGRGGYDQVFYDQDARYGGNKGVKANLATGTIYDGWGQKDTVSNIEAVIGTRFADAFVGSANNDEFWGLGGIDSYNGGAGLDRICFDGTRDDYPTHGVTVNLSLASGQVVNDGFDNKETTVSIEDVRGSNFGDSITGSNGDNDFDAQDGDDILNALGGNDTLQGEDGNDTLDGGTGTDRMEGGDGDDIYVMDIAGDVVDEGGGSGVDTVRTATMSIKLADATRFLGEVENAALLGSLNVNVFGNGLNNGLTGNTGSNILNGYAGLDVLTGGGGNDNFYFTTALDASTNVDRIADFANLSGNNDAIRLAKSVFAALTGASGAVLTKEQFVANASGAATDTLQHILYETDTGKLFYDADGNKAGGVAAVQFAQLGTTASHPSTITNADFFLI